MEGFWTIQFQGVEGFGSGVVTLIDGHVFGGDGGYLYVGKYADAGGQFSAQVHVSPYRSGVPNVMGETEFDLEMIGLDMVGAATAKTLHVEGRIPGTAMKLKGTLAKKADMPTRK